MALAERQNQPLLRILLPIPNRERPIGAFVDRPHHVHCVLAQPNQQLRREPPPASCIDGSRRSPWLTAPHLGSFPYFLAVCYPRRPKMGSFLRPSSSAQGLGRASKRR